jgi:hypothetical protein
MVQLKNKLIGPKLKITVKFFMQKLVPVWYRTCRCCYHSFFAEIPELFFFEAIFRRLIFSPKTLIVPVLLACLHILIHLYRNANLSLSWNLPKYLPQELTYCRPWPALSPTGGRILNFLWGVPCIRILSTLHICPWFELLAELVNFGSYGENRTRILTSISHPPAWKKNISKSNSTGTVSSVLYLHLI